MGTCPACRPDCKDCRAERTHALTSALLLPGVTVNVCNKHYEYSYSGARVVQPDDARDRVLAKRYARLRKEYASSAWDESEREKRLTELLSLVSMTVPDMSRNGAVSKEMRALNVRHHGFIEYGIAHTLGAVILWTTGLVLGFLNLIPTGLIAPLFLASALLYAEARMRSRRQ